MRPLQSMQMVLTWFCVCPFLDANAKWRKLANVVFSSVWFGTIAFHVSACGAFVWLSVDFRSSLDSLRAIMGWTPLIIEFIIVIRIKHEIVALFDELSEIYKKSKFSKNFS